MEKLKNLRIKQMIDLLNKWEYKRVASYAKALKYKQQKRINEAIEKAILLDRFVCKLHNRILKYIPKETILRKGKKIIKDDLPMWNNYTIIKFY